MTGTEGVVEAGIDTWRTVWKADASSVGTRLLDLADGYVGQWFPEHGLLAVEGHPDGPQVLARPEGLGSAIERVSELVEPFGGEFLGVSRVDLTATHRFARESEARAFFGGMASVSLPRLETSRRGHPAHSVWWTGQRGRTIKARVYDKGLERGGEAWQLGRLEDQRRFKAGVRPELDAVSDGAWCRERFRARFGQLERAVDGVRAASFPVIAQAIADEARYGYRTIRQAERLAGSLVLLTGGIDRGDRDSAQQRWFDRRRAELREAGFVVADDLIEPAEVDLGAVVGAAVESEAWS